MGNWKRNYLYFTKGDLYISSHPYLFSSKLVIKREQPHDIITEE